MDSSVAIAERFNIPKILIGTTLVSFITSSPELCVSIIAAVKKHTDISISNVIGSCICNASLILGLGFLFAKEEKINGKGIYLIKEIFLIVATLILLPFAISFKELNFLLGIIFLFLFGLFMFYSIRKAYLLFEIKDIPFNPLKVIFGLIVGGGGVILGSHLALKGGVIISDCLGLRESVIGLSLISLSTSLPEMSTAISAAKKGHIELSIGSILGSNFIDITVIFGIVTLIKALPIYHGFIQLDIPLSLSLALLIYAFTYGKRWKIKGILLLLIYFSYIYFIYR